MQECEYIESQAVLSQLKNSGPSLAMSSLSPMSVNACLIGITWLIWLLPQPSPSVDVGLFCVGMLCVGIPHGALDHLKFFSNHKRHLFNAGKSSLSTRDWVHFLGFYAAFMALSGLLWLVFSPLVSICIFLAYSAIHFGQSQLERNMRFPRPFHVNLPLYFVYGGTILAQLILLHFHEASLILKTAFEINAFMSASGAFWFTFAFTAATSLILIMWYFQQWMDLDQTIAQILGLVFLFQLNRSKSFLFSFTLYFIGWHSGIAALYLKKDLSFSWRSIFLHCIPFSTASIIFLVIIVRALDMKDLSASLPLFISLSIVSLPHFLIQILT